MDLHRCLNMFDMWGRKTPSCLLPALGSTASWLKGVTHRFLYWLGWPRRGIPPRTHPSAEQPSSEIHHMLSHTWPCHQQLRSHRSRSKGTLRSLYLASGSDPTSGSTASDPLVPGLARDGVHDHHYLPNANTMPSCHRNLMVTEQRPPLNFSPELRP